MNDKDIIQLALEHFGAVLKPSDLEVKFAALVTAAEREACANYVAESFGKELVDGQDIAAAIRARGETWHT